MVKRTSKKVSKRRPLKRALKKVSKRRPLKRASKKGSKRRSLKRASKKGSKRRSLKRASKKGSKRRSSKRASKKGSLKKLTTGTKKISKKVSKGSKKAYKKVSKGSKKAYKKLSKGSKKAYKKLSKGSKKAYKKLSRGSKNLSNKLDKGARDLTHKFKLSPKKSVQTKSSLLKTNTFVKKEQLTATPLVYYTHDNGARPFKFVASNKGINVYTHDLNDNGSTVNYNKHLLRFTKFLGFWVGYDTSQYNFNGNTILIQETKLTYVAITWDIVRFKTSEEILDYVSPVGNSDVPYPVAYTKNYVYFLIDNKYVPKVDLLIKATVENADHIYSEFYGHINQENYKKMRKYDINVVKKLVKRQGF